MKLRLIRIIAIVLLAVSGFAVISMLELFGRKSEKSEVAVPNQAKWILRVDVATLLKEEALTVLFEEKDEQLLKSLRTFAENSVSKDERPKLFINIFSEMVVFGTEVKGHQFTGILLQLNNPKVFEQNIPEYLSSDQTFAIEGNTALILTKTDNSILAKELQTEISKSLIANSSKVSSSRERKDNEYISFELKDQKGKLEKADVGILFSKNDVALTGNLKLKGQIKMSAYDVKHENFYLSSAFVPEDFPKTIFRTMQLGELNFPPVESMSFNYNGIVIENGSSMFRLPKINAIVTTKTTVKIEDLIAQVPEQFRIEGNKLKFSNVVYHLIQLDDKTVFFGIDPTAIIRKSPSSPLVVKGDLQKLAAIEADGMIMTGINILVPQYNLFNVFTKSTENVKMELVPEKGNSYKVSGNLKFKDQSSALATMTRLFLGFKGAN